MNKTLLFTAFATISVSAAEPPVPAKIEFNRDVRPILSDNCFYCHGNDPKHREADLRLDIRAEAITAKAFVPGEVKDSELVARILTDDEDDLMPPPDTHKKLTQRQKDILKKWIEQGAGYQQHWAYEKPVKAAIPAGKNGVDVLVQKRLAEIGLKPSPQADKRTLIRRVYFDLLGLPPTPEEVAAFEKDTTPDAYAQMVDRVLKNPHYGERMAIGWLDVVRFADTIGYHSDNSHNVWPYRDYVIKAFNTNKRFDRFTIEQIAGDLMPDTNQETKVGSAFNRLILSTEEGGAQAKDYEQRMLTDRVRAIGNAWMGQTTGCAQCHDHKFDPFNQRDFYALGAFFADIKEPLIGRRETGMMVLDAEAEKKQADIAKRLAALQAEFAKPRPDLAAAQAAWEKQALEAVITSGSWQPLKPLTSASAKKNVALKADKDGIVRGSIDKKRVERQQNDGTETYTITAKVPQGITGIRIDALKDKSPGIGLASNGNFVLSEVALSAGRKNKPAKLAVSHASATFEQPKLAAASVIDGIADKKDNGWGVLGATGADQSLYLELAEPIADADTTVTIALTFAYGENHEIANLRLNTTNSPKPLRAPATSLPAKEIADILKVTPEKRAPVQKQKLEAAFKQIAPELSDLRTKLATVEKEKADFEVNAPKCIVSISDTAKRTVRILPRGDWMNESGEVVKASLPGYLPKPKIDGRDLTRLDLAQWLVSKENPLTARTVMNRLWKQFFGTGLSKVLDDLGAQGEPPVNPALLDWLACEFMDSGWDFQHMVRVIVSSDTYKQVSTSTKELTAADPYNRECARQSTFRLDAEIVRDNALAISGLLVPKIGGPSVKPYQPAKYWENLNFPVREWQNDSGESLYRRGMYTWWQRSFLHPSLVAFDAPSREECTAERNRSNIPQQALVLLNDPTYVEAARAFAARILTECNGDATKRINWACQQALQRQPSVDEMKTISALFEKHLADYTQDPAAAEALLKTGAAPTPVNLNKSELAAWTHVARVLINLHETITRS
ncbi:PSD1 and planctomycete cytochrome C domain-containing protein [Prosthecobacter sp.]|uniref:PSD1 and planctomycete cytochrome C domain-containing protein n=1 Tax=Prosthecobacter sp. TaxID=1965333 RepID=UPI002ABACC7F|nr:PSD1 and planctomycete cytochrome C domain-containing protein [Prosthecobacter sp.]MDZ4405123.1 PSD1 and planctomycete cytochrome C domain-containing protein [Prosthecobacter sp.]